LWLGNRDLRSEPLHRRREWLEDVLDGSQLIFPIRRLPADGRQAWKLVREYGWEGFVAKDSNSPYRAGHSASWAKVKMRQEGEFVVGGIGKTADGRPRLFIGERTGTRLAYRGAVELGVGRALVGELFSRARRQRASPFEGLRSRGVLWLEPTTTVAVSYGRIMQGRLREPACRGLVDGANSAKMTIRGTRGSAAAR
jgi:bifunctional non-homologous end joining protein LigD